MMIVGKGGRQNKSVKQKIEVKREEDRLEKENVAGRGCRRCRGEGKQHPNHAARALRAWYRRVILPPPPKPPPLQPAEVSSAMWA